MSRNVRRLLSLFAITLAVMWFDQVYIVQRETRSITVSPSVTTVKPSVTTVKPSVTTVKPSVTTVKPSVTNVSPSIITKPSSAAIKFPKETVNLYKKTKKHSKSTRKRFNPPIKHSKRTSKYNDPRLKYGSTSCQGDETAPGDSTNTISTTSTVIACSGTFVACTGANTTCRGFNVKCEGPNLVHQAKDVYRGDDLTCRGDSVTCTGQDMVCTDNGKPCSEIRLQCKMPPIFYRDVTPDTRKYNIYLTETSARSYIRNRFICAVESYCKLNPRAVVWLLTTACHLDDSTTHQLMALKVVYPNLEVATINVGLALKSTPLEELYNSEKLWTSKYLIENLSNSLRLAVVYKSGGFYSDTDIINWKSVYNITNTVSKQRADSVNTAAFHFVRGHPFLWVMMADVVKNYKGSTWGEQGPQAITRVLIKYGCFPSASDGANAGSSASQDEHQTSRNTSTPIWGSICNLAMLPEDAFFPPNRVFMSMIFSPTPDARNVTSTYATNSSSIRELLPTSIGVHLTNHLTKDKKIVTGSILSSLCSSVCPLVWTPNM